ncbi:MAG: transglycosylase SLT domain-containing protein [candidate division WOR-3 bacterium]
MPIKRVYVSLETEDMLKKHTIEILNEIRNEDEELEKLIKAIIEVETAHYHFAIRYEPQLKKQDWYLKLLNKEEQQNDFAYCSYGLTQILYGIAKYYGYSEAITNLFYPKNCIKYSFLYLKDLFKRYKNIKDVIASYNSGIPKKNENNEYINQKYVDSVYEIYKFRYNGKYD